MNKRSLFKIAIKLNKPIYNVVLFAIEKCTEIFPNNKGKIYLSNILAYFVNEINHNELIEKFDYIPNFTLDKLKKVLETLNGFNLINLWAGTRNAVIVTLNNENYSQYKSYIEKNDLKSINDNDLKNVCFVILEIDKLFPKNSGKIYISNILSYLINEINFPVIAKNLFCIPKYTPNDIKLILKELNNMEIVVLKKGKNGAFFITYDEGRLTQFLNSFNREINDNDVNLISYVCIEINKLFPNNMGKVYASNILTYLVNDINKNNITEIYGSVPAYSVNTLDKIFIRMEKKNLCQRAFGSRGALFIILNKEFINNYIGRVDNDFSDNDKFLILFCIKHLSDLYPKNKGRVYISNLTAFIKMDRTVILLNKKIKYYKCFNKTEIEKITDILKQEKLIGKFVGHRGSQYVMLYSKANNLYFNQKNLNLFV